MQKQKIWTVKDGKIGTAHISRDGREVDFRSCSHWMFVHGNPGGAVEFFPAKSVEIQHLSIPVTIKSIQPIPEIEGRLNEIWDAEFRGIHLTGETQIWSREFIEKSNQNYDKFKARMEARNNLRKSLEQFTAIQFLNHMPLTKRIKGRLQRKHIRRSAMRDELLVQFWNKMASDNLTLNSGLRMSKNFWEDIDSIIEDERKCKKEAWQEKLNNS